jgi:hypothetical protein
VGVLNGLFEPFIYTMLIVPRRARDKHRETRKQTSFSHLRVPPSGSSTSHQMFRAAGSMTAQGRCWPAV